MHNTRLTQSGDFSVRTLADFGELRLHAPELCEASAAPDAFSSLPWFENLIAHGIDLAGGDARGMVLCLVRHGPSGAAFCVPLRSRGSGLAAAFGPTLESLSNYYASLYGPIGAPEHCSVDALRALLRHLRQLRSGAVPSAVLDLNPLDESAPFYRHLLAALRAEGWLADSYFCFGNWYLEVAGRSFDAYYPSVPSRLRNTIKRGHKKLAAEGAWSLRIHAEPGAELEQAIADFDAVYRQSWKVPEPFPNFVPELCRAMARAGWLRLGVVRLGDGLTGAPIAAQLWIVRDGRALIYKLAYDEAFKRLSAGSVLSAALMRHAIDVDGAVEVDYLTGDDAYKADWMSHRRERRGIVAFHAMSAQGLVSAARHHLGRWARRIRPAAEAAPQAAEAAHV